MKKMKILLISGHGAGDPGAPGNGYLEADLTREVVSNVAPKLSKYADVTVFDMSQNMYKNLNAGATFNFKEYDYVSEIHFNSAAKDLPTDGKATGAEILVHSSEKGWSVEEGILNNLASLGFKNRGVKPVSNLLVMNTCKGKQGVSYSLIEVCFVKDADDMKLYQAKKNEVAEAIAKGIADGFGLAMAEPVVTGNDITYELKQKYKITFDSVENEREFIQLLDEERKKSSKLYWVYYKLANR